MENFKVDFNAIEWETPLPGMRFKRFCHHGKQLRLLEFKRGFVEPDWCKKGHIGMVLEGTLEVDFKGRVVTFKTGDGVFIPPGPAGAHKARPLSPVVRLVLVENS